MDYFEFETLVEDEGNDKYLILIIYMIYLIINIAWKYQSFWKAMEQEYKNLHLKRG